MSNPEGAAAGLEMWGGVECTVNRVGDRYFDQLARSGHADRLEDLDRIAALGVRALRFPLLWERHQFEPGGAIDWSWADVRLGRLRQLGVRPILGLVHHGSGPRWTSLVDDSFAEELADFARRAARRFPWVEDYTPVNEPLTTARFSGLYGHWHPHGRDALTFARALLNECRATVLSMAAVREVQPIARLVQTEDLGKTHSTPALRYQADFENERRWLTFDLLLGRVRQSHPMWGYLRWIGVSERDLEWFLDHPRPPDLLGLNYYMTSERFLDERIERYPSGASGGNGRHKYADVEAVRVLAGGAAGPCALLGEVWRRYRLPLAVTEVHLGCTREEQLRWLQEVWQAAQCRLQEGEDVRAVTAWSLLGAYDWNTLLTQETGHYESGAFDLRSSEPRPTALAQLIQDLSAGRAPAHPVLSQPGWWRRPLRLLHPPVHTADAQRPAQPLHAGNPSEARPILLVEPRCRLGRALAHACFVRGLSCQALQRADLDILSPESIRAALEEFNPWAVVNCFGAAPATAERTPDFHRTVVGAAHLAGACADLGVRLAAFSSDEVFDGERTTPYRESDATCPVGAFGRALVQAETRIRDIYPAALQVRTGPFIGTNAASDEEEIRSVTFLPDLVRACLDLLIDGSSGLWHLVNFQETPQTSLGVRRRQRLLASERGQLLPTLPLGFRRPAALTLEAETVRASLGS